MANRAASASRAISRALMISRIFDTSILGLDVTGARVNPREMAPVPIHAPTSLPWTGHGHRCDELGRHRRLPLFPREQVRADFNPRLMREGSPASQASSASCGASCNDIMPSPPVLQDPICQMGRRQGHGGFPVPRSWFQAISGVRRSRPAASIRPCLRAVRTLRLSWQK